MKLAARVVEHLESRGVPCALVCGVALGAHGIARATLDIDILVVSPAVLEPTFWATLKGAPAPEIRKGDADDPLLGIVRLTHPQEPVDVIVGRGAWMERSLGRRITIEVEGSSSPRIPKRCAPRSTPASPVCPPPCASSGDRSRRRSRLGIPALSSGDERAYRKAVAVSRPETARLTMPDRSHYPVRRHRLGDEPRDDHVRGLTPSERVAMVEQLTIQAWTFKDGRWDGARLRRDVVRTLRGRR